MQDTWNSRPDVDVFTNTLDSSSLVEVSCSDAFSGYRDIRLVVVAQGFDEDQD